MDVGGGVTGGGGAGRRGFRLLVNRRLRLIGDGRGGVAQDHGVGLALGGGGEGAEDAGLEQTQFLALLGELVQQAHVVFLLALHCLLELALVLAQFQDEDLGGVQPFLQAGAGDGVFHKGRRVGLGVELGAGRRPGVDSPSSRSHN